MSQAAARALFDRYRHGGTSEQPTTPPTILQVNQAQLTAAFDVNAALYAAGSEKITFSNEGEKKTFLKKVLPPRPASPPKHGNQCQGRGCCLHPGLFAANICSEAKGQDQEDRTAKGLKDRAYRKCLVYW